MSDFSSKTLFLYLQDQLGHASPREALVGQHCHHSLALELKLFLLQLADTPRRLLWHFSQTKSFWTWIIWAFSPLQASFSTTLFRKLNYNMIIYFLNFNPSYTHTHTHTHTHTPMRRISPIFSQTLLMYRASPQSLQYESIVLEEWCPQRDP